MTTVVITPVAEELEVLTGVFDRLWGSHGTRDVGRLQVADYHSRGVILCEGGLGKAQFAVTTQHLMDNLASPGLVVCAGVAGSLTTSARIGDVIVGTATVEHDFNPRALDSHLPEFEGSARHLAALREARIAERGEFRVRLGRIASGDEAIMDSDRARELRALTGALAVAWEGAGGARAATFSQVPYVEVRGISDMADHEAVDTWKANRPYAMRNVASLVAWLAGHPIPPPAAKCAPGR